MVLSAVKTITCAVLFASQFAAKAAMFQRQAPPANPSAIITDTPSATLAPDASLAPSTVTTFVIVTSFAPAPEPSQEQVSTFLDTSTVSGQPFIETRTITLNPTLTVTDGLPMPVIPTSVTSSNPDGNGQSSSNKGAIAGGVLGGLAILVAAFAAFVWFRRRSPKHWRNRTAGRWQSFDYKNGDGSHAHHAIYVGQPVNRAQLDDSKTNDPNPLPPLYIRDRQSAPDQFGDAPGAPSSPQSHARSGSMSAPSHHRRDSSMGGRYDVELLPTGGSSSSW
ncbi:hypothetical protein NP233_g9494 [Leucocoprinus birnbaumii]|uniref:Mid2 domain-containing protein n=1 Tax=Leucocoprinus birnbaumii TaxID=56174 RepID=A0AAD5VK46_9AGAR|nr:hypothetical protein NP233_g9494 [Leucocoprinus birnbaumii]